MKRIMTICALALFLLSGCARGQGQMEYIGADSAKRLALEAAGLSVGEVQFSGTDMGTRNGMDYYEVCFTCGGNSYRYDIEAMTGVIIDSETPGAAPVETAGAPQESSLVTDADTFLSASDVPGPDPAQVPAAVTPASGSVQGGNQEAGMLTAEEAKAKALAHAGLSADQVTFVKAKVDWDDGRQVYEIEFYASDYREFDYEIDPYTGEVLNFDYEAEYYEPPSGAAGSPISADSAKKLALAQVPGATEADIWEFETDYDDGRLEYEGKIIYNQTEYEFEIDGYSGAIRSWEAEPVYNAAHH